jgi:hypothetical protein
MGDNVIDANSEIERQQMLGGKPSMTLETLASVVSSEAAHGGRPFG